MATVNVTAATGQLGGRIVRELLARGQAPNDIVASVRTPEKARDLADAGLKVRQASYDDKDSLRRAFEGSDTVMLIPSFAPVEPRIVQHANAIEAASESGIGRVVFASFIGGRVDSPFTISPFYVCAESKLRISGLGWTVLRNGMYADPLVDYMPELVRMGRIPYPAGDGRISYVSRDDLARASAAACLDDTQANRVYELTGPEALSIAQLADIVTRVAGKPVRYEPASDEEFADMCREPGLPDYIPRALVTLYHAAARGVLGAVTDHVEKLTGKPAEDLESYLTHQLGDER